MFTKLHKPPSKPEDEMLLSLLLGRLHRGWRAGNLLLEEEEETQSNVWFLYSESELWFGFIYLVVGSLHP